MLLLLTAVGLIVWIVLMVLKLLDLLDWSWLAITAPIWIVVCFDILFGLLVTIPYTLYRNHQRRKKLGF